MAGALLIRLVFSSDLHGAPLYAMMISLAYIWTSTRLFLKYRRIDASACRIAYEDDKFLIPRAFFRPHCIHRDELKSIETFRAASGQLAVMLGRKEKSTVFLTERSFSSTAEFQRFVEFLIMVLHADRPSMSSAGLATVGPLSEVKDRLPLLLLTLMMLIAYMVIASPSVEVASTEAIAMGGLIKTTLQLEEPYRIASSFFLHYNPIHLGTNLLALTIFGRHVHAVMGNVRFANITFLSAFSGSLVSLVLSPFGIVVGASGGILGLFGAYSFLCLRFQNQLPGSISISRRAVLFVLVIQIISDVSVSGVDSFSHIGGFLFGFMYTALASPGYAPPQAGHTTPAEQCIAACVTGFYAYGFLYFLTAYCCGR